jgi:peptide/nickel transport system ATP-binding protein
VTQDDNILVELKDLYVNFYTYQGVVKAIDGVDLTIRKGETLGLVGETGCGKSVTASAIMKLILTPPGKIEAGSVYFLEPPEVRAKRVEYEAKAQAWYSGMKPEQKAKLVASHGMRFTGFKKRIKPLTPEEAKKLSIPVRAPSRIVALYMSDMARKVPKQDRTTVDALRRSYDLISKSEQYMQLIRGRWVSMIFQEPTSALNPVFTAGNQIAEVILLHRRAEMAARALKRMETDAAMEKKKGRPRKLIKGSGPPTGKPGSGNPSKTVIVCSYCGKEVQADDFFCPSCGVHYRGEIAFALRKPFIATSKRMLQMIAKKPEAKEFFLGKIPGFNLYRKDMHKEALKEAVAMLRTVRIPDPMGIATRYPYELSGGMQQRVMIAIALACNPKLLIADEPTTALDVTIQGQILKLMRDLKAEFGSSILLITHNLGVVAEMCDRVGVMYAGSMAEIAPARVIFKEQLHPYTQGLMKSVPSAQMDAQTLYTIRGTVPNLIYPPSGCRFHPRCDYAKKYCERVKPELLKVGEDHYVSCHMVNKAEGYVNE